MTEDTIPSSLEAVLRANGWQDTELMLLGTPAMAKLFLGEIRKARAYQLALFNVPALQEHGHKLLEEVFTEALTAELGYAPAVRTRLLGVMKSRYRPCKPRNIPTPVTTIAELHGLGWNHLATKEPNLGKVSANYAQAVLRHLGLRFIDSPDSR